MSINGLKDSLFFSTHYKVKAGEQILLKDFEEQNQHNLGHQSHAQQGVGEDHEIIGRRSTLIFRDRGSRLRLAAANSGSVLRPVAQMGDAIR